MKKLFASAVIAAIWLSTVSTFAFTPDVNFVAWEEGRGTFMQGGPAMHMKIKGALDGGVRFGTATVAALEAKDYDAFVTAWNADQAKVTAPTQEDFTQQVEMQKIHDTMETAIANNDYTSFVSALKSLPAPTNPSGTASTSNTKIIEQKIPSQEEFTQMVNNKKNQDLMQAAIKSNDYSAYLTAWNTNKPTVPTKDQFTLMTERVTQFSQNALKKGSQTLTKIKKALKAQ